MSKKLSQAEIDKLVSLLTTFKDYDSSEELSEDLLKNQVILTQDEIDRLIETLNLKGPNVNISHADRTVILSQKEIDKLVDALGIMKQYDTKEEFFADFDNNQSILTQEEIDRLIILLQGIKE